MELGDRDRAGRDPAEAQPRMITYVILTAMTVISATMFLPALPAMQVAFGVSEAVIGLAVSVFMIAAAVLQLVLGPLSDRVGRRPVVLGVLAVYALASLVCLLAQSITLFLLARMVQAVAMTGGILVGAMVRDRHDRKEAAAKPATISSAMAVVPLMAPVLGGYLELTLGWRPGRRRRAPHGSAEKSAGSGPMRRRGLWAQAGFTCSLWDRPLWCLRGWWGGSGRSA